MTTISDGVKQKTATSLRETSGPTTLPIGAVADGKVLGRVGDTVVGVDAGGGSAGPLAQSERVLSADVTIPDNYSAFVQDGLDLNGHDITFGDGSTLVLVTDAGGSGGGVALTAIDLGPITDDVQGAEPAVNLRLIGIAVTEWAGDTAEIILRNGEDNTSPRLCSNITLNNAESMRDMFGAGLDAADGIFVQVVSGEVGVVLFTNGAS